MVDIHKVRGRRPRYDVYIGRAVQGTEFVLDSKWANPYGHADLYEGYIRRKIGKNPAFYDLRELVGRMLGCWCVTAYYIPALEKKCHGFVLIKLIREVGLEKCR